MVVRDFATTPSSLSWLRGYKTFFMLNSVEHKILEAHKYKFFKEFGFLGSDKPGMLFFPLINVNNCWHFNIYEQEKIHAQLS